MGKKKSTGGALGQAIIRSKRKNKSVTFGIGPVNSPSLYNDPNSIATLTDSSRSGPTSSSQGAEGVSKAWKNLNSITDQGDLDSFLQNAVLSERQFTAEKGAIIVQQNKAFEVVQKSQDELEAERAQTVLKVPRRPNWTKDMTIIELEREENKAFLNWRRGLARIEQEKGLTITPFEKNIEIWRQFWRVIEKSDALMQIVDARDPLFFASEDVVNYVKETGSYKKSFLLINKSDMLSTKQRIEWAKYFKSHGISYLFWSALKSQKDDQEEKKEKEASTLAIPLSEEAIEKKEKEKERIAAEEEELSEEDKKYLDDVKIRTGSELLTLFHKIKAYVQRTLKTDRRVTIGMVGYPNVGKSSTINAICGCKRVAVTSTPGKTKHFQTINLSDDLTLCDCPGLVFPSFVGSRADMVCNGVLPIDQMSDYVSPVVLVCERIPSQVLYAKYGLSDAKIPESFGVKEYEEAAPKFLRIFAAQRGFFTAHGEPDMSRAARRVMKDYVSGAIFFGHPPPGIAADTYHSTTISPENLVEESIAAALVQPVTGPVEDSPKIITSKKKQRRNKKKDKYAIEQSSSQPYHIAGAYKGKKKFIIVEKTPEEMEDK